MLVAARAYAVAGTVQMEVIPRSKAVAVEFTRPSLGPVQPCANPSIDVNGDCVFDLQDVVDLQQIIADGGMPRAARHRRVGTSFNSSDFNRDLIMDTVDVTYLLLYAFGKMPLLVGDSAFQYQSVSRTSGCRVKVTAEASFRYVWLVRSFQLFSIISLPYSNSPQYEDLTSNSTVSEAGALRLAGDHWVVFELEDASRLDLSTNMLAQEAGLSLFLVTSEQQTAMFYVQSKADLVASLPVSQLAPGASGGVIGVPAFDGALPIGNDQTSLECHWMSPPCVLGQKAVNNPTNLLDRSCQDCQLARTYQNQGSDCYELCGCYNGSCAENMPLWSLCFVSCQTGNHSLGAWPTTCEQVTRCGDMETEYVAPTLDSDRVCVSCVGEFSNLTACVEMLRQSDEAGLDFVMPVGVLSSLAVIIAVVLVLFFIRRHGKTKQQTASGLTIAPGHVRVAFENPLYAEKSKNWNAEEEQFEDVSFVHNPLYSGTGGLDSPPARSKFGLFGRRTSAAAAEGLNSIGMGYLDIAPDHVDNNGTMEDDNYENLLDAEPLYQDFDLPFTENEYGFVGNGFEDFESARTDNYMEVGFEGDDASVTVDSSHYGSSVDRTSDLRAPALAQDYDEYDLYGFGETGRDIYEELALVDD